MELISHHQPKEFGKGQKETPHVRHLPESSLNDYVDSVTLEDLVNEETALQSDYVI